MYKEYEDKDERMKKLQDKHSHYGISTNKELNNKILFKKLKTDIWKFITE